MNSTNVTAAALFTALALTAASAHAAWDQSDWVERVEISRPDATQPYKVTETPSTTLESCIKTWHKAMANYPESEIHFTCRVPQSTNPETNLEVRVYSGAYYPHVDGGKDPSVTLVGQVYGRSADAAQKGYGYSYLGLF